MAPLPSYAGLEYFDSRSFPSLLQFVVEIALRRPVFHIPVRGIVCRKAKLLRDGKNIANTFSDILRIHDNCQALIGGQHIITRPLGGPIRNSWQVGF